ncbi:hypothetical protein EYC84_003532 [Monilinia fructicola]|uniref:Uncharacterized protein n=1 Tax=Monilinia fructicola TaxID=38448 RepID=A0A5M9JWF4_MONFR|nr:hypothetical protein EYC84_003532 [Monilinia fructicola]
MDDRTVAPTVISRMITAKEASGGLVTKATHHTRHQHSKHDLRISLPHSPFLTSRPSPRSSPDRLRLAS